jgi:hypothetical protein
LVESSHNLWQLGINSNTLEWVFVINSGGQELKDLRGLMTRQGEVGRMSHKEFNGSG